MVLATVKDLHLIENLNVTCNKEGFHDIEVSYIRGYIEAITKKRFGRGAYGLGRLVCATTESLNTNSFKKVAGLWREVVVNHNEEAANANTGEKNIDFVGVEGMFVEITKEEEDNVVKKMDAADKNLTTSCSFSTTLMR
ncbi:hypothetical protein L2E82_30355 [Cichorium intybus]|uniref:Uncharacterized protein n=1 Tax=Cichorium intybus TaxID=13427 RepID=A0ACB9D0D2_CICIN|nr:hypothetical protein L2E82_30355 [Cichorium intybus]